MAKTETKLNEWEENALHFMRARGNGQNMGLMINKDHPSAALWWKYFMHKGMRDKANYMSARLREGKEYMVPCENPSELDFTYTAPNSGRRPYNDD